jgi:hypothetical protein
VHTIIATVNLDNWRVELIRHKIKTMRRDVVSKVMSEMGRKGGKAAKVRA